MIVEGFLEDELVVDITEHELVLFFSPYHIGSGAPAVDSRGKDEPPQAIWSRRATTPANPKERSHRSLLWSAARSGVPYRPKEWNRRKVCYLPHCWFLIDMFVLEYSLYPCQWTRIGMFCIRERWQRTIASPSLLVNCNPKVVELCEMVSSPHYLPFTIASCTCHMWSPFLLLTDRNSLRIIPFPFQHQILCSYPEILDQSIVNQTVTILLSFLCIHAESEMAESNKNTRERQCVVDVIRIGILSLALILCYYLLPQLVVVVVASILLLHRIRHCDER